MSNAVAVVPLLGVTDGALSWFGLTAMTADAGMAASSKPRMPARIQRLARVAGPTDFPPVAWTLASGATRAIAEPRTHMVPRLAALVATGNLSQAAPKIRP